MSGYIRKTTLTYRKGSIIRCFAPLFFLFIALASAVLLWPEECLTAESEGRMMLALPISKGELFMVSFTHSLNLSPVTDIFEWTETGIVLRKSIFSTFGAGIPVPSDGIGTELVHVDGHYELLGIDKKMQSFNIMTQTIPDHYLNIKERRISLLNLVGPGKVVEISVKRVPRLARLLTAK